MSWCDYYEQFGPSNSKFVGLDGKPVKRTPFSHPYSYDEYVIWKDDDANLNQSIAAYSDRLFQWDSEKYNKCCEETFKNKGQYFYEREPEEIQKFLSLYFEKEVKLTAVVQACNQATGYPYWIFLYEEN